MINLKELYLTYPVENLFHTLTKDLVIKIDEKEYPNFIFFFNKDNEIIFEYSYKSKYRFFYCNYEKYWAIFYEKFKFNYNQVSDITKDMVENHFIINEITPLMGIIEVKNNIKFNEITSSASSFNSFSWIEKYFG